MKNIYLIFLLIFVIYGQAQTTTITYTPSTVIFANPERGLQKYSITNSSYATTSNFSNITTTSITNWRTGADKVTVIFRYFLLENFMSTNISQTYLDNMQIDFDRIRAAGLKVIVRFAYSNTTTSSPYQPSKSQILQHITQLAPILNLNKDIILTHQAGFIGKYGEWYYTNSSEFGTESSINATQWANRKEVVDAMLAATPIEIPLQVRYVGAKTKMYGTSSLNSTTAFQNTPNARIGFYNDAFLNDYGDQGTYDVSSQYQNPVGTPEYNYLMNETKYLPSTAETNGINAPRTDGANAVYEMDLVNITTINRDYYIPNFTNWIASGHYDVMLRNLGYRFELTTATLPNNSIVGGTLPITLNIKNNGYATPFKSRSTYIVLKNTSTSQTYSLPVTSDCRRWESPSTVVSQTLNLPGAMPVGSYKVYLYMPDPSSSISSRSEYAIRFANENMWENTTGYNDLTHTVTISAATSVPSNTISSVGVVCNNSVLMFSSSSTNSPTAYTWTISSPLSTQTSTLVNPSYTVSTTGTHTLSLITQNGAGSSGVSSITFTATARPTLTISGLTTACVGSGVSLSASGASTYTWNTGLVGSALTVTPSTAGTVNYTVTGTNGTGCTNTRTISVTATARPTLTISGLTTVCVGTGVSLSASGASTYTWNTGLVGSALTVTPSTAGTVNYTVTGTNGAGCTNTRTISVIVDSKPSVIVNSGAILCTGGVFTISPTGAASYTINGGSFVVSPTITTSYSVIATSSSGCLSDVSISTVSVQTSLSVSITGSTTICSGSTTTLSANGASSYTWSTGEQSNSIIVSPTSTTNYSLTGTGGNCSSTAQIGVIVNMPPSVTIVSSNSVLCVGQTATLTAAGADIYNWQLLGSGASVYVNPTSSTNYTVEGTDLNGCTSTAVFFQEAEVCTSIMDLVNEQNSITIFPNPSNGSITISQVNKEEVKIQDVTGKTVFQGFSDNGKINLSYLANGTYMVIIKDRKSYFVIQK